MKIDIYVICRNEIKLAPFFIDYWKSLADNINVYVIDGDSTDGTREYLSQFNFVHIFNKGFNEINDALHLIIKNNCWKKSRGKVDFVMVCDFDETIFSWDVVTLRKELEFMKDNGYTILKPNSFEIVGDKTPIYQKGKFLHEICEYGINNDKYYSKPILFNPNEITEINFCLGAHYSKPIGNIKWYYSKDLYLIHAKWVNLNEYIEKITNREISNFNTKSNLYAEKDKTIEDIENEFNEKITKRFKWSELKNNNKKPRKI